MPRPESRAPTSRRAHAHHRLVHLRPVATGIASRRERDSRGGRRCAGLRRARRPECATVRDPEPRNPAGVGPTLDNASTRLSLDPTCASDWRLHARHRAQRSRGSSCRGGPGKLAGPGYARTSSRRLSPFPRASPRSRRRARRAGPARHRTERTLVGLAEATWEVGLVSRWKIRERLSKSYVREVDERARWARDSHVAPTERSLSDRSSRRDRVCRPPLWAERCSYTLMSVRASRWICARSGVHRVANAEATDSTREPARALTARGATLEGAAEQLEAALALPAAEDAVRMPGRAGEFVTACTSSGPAAKQPTGGAQRAHEPPERDPRELGA